MRSLNEQEHRQRLINLRDTDNLIKSCSSKYTVKNYMSGQVIYNLGEYPARFSIMPTEYDYKLLKEFADSGVKLIQIHEDWNDSIRVLGADKFSSFDDEGMKKFIELVHMLGMKIIPYMSSGYFHKTDPDFKEEWAQYDPIYSCTNLHMDYAMCSPASPGWRAYLIPKLKGMLDKYEFDGLYNDSGYYPLCKIDGTRPEHISPEPETPEHDAALEDLLGVIMDMVHERGGVVKLHYSGIEGPKCTSKVYDYLWVGEGIDNIDYVRDVTKYYAPYVVPCLGLTFAEPPDEDEHYLNSIPYMQFPLRVDGRPYTGERAFVPGVKYKPFEQDEFRKLFKKVYENYLAHPNGPYVYGEWDSMLYPRPDARRKWLYYLNLYLPMVNDNSKCWIDIKESGIFIGNVSKDVVASMFVNEKIYLVLANFSKSNEFVETKCKYKNREVTGCVGSRFEIPSRQLLFLEKIIE